MQVLSHNPNPLPPSGTDLLSAWEKCVSLVRFSIPGILLILAIALDLSSAITVTMISLICVVSLAVSAFFLPSRQIVGWTVVYALGIAGTLWMRRGDWAPISVNTEILITTRSLVVVSAGVLAYCLARAREKDKRMIRKIQMVFDLMDIPVINSNGDGWVVYLNGPARDLLSAQKGRLQTPFFQHFSAVMDKGKSIQKYFDLAGGKITGPISIPLALEADKSNVRWAVMIRARIGGNRNVLTLLYPEKPAERLGNEEI